MTENLGHKKRRSDFDFCQPDRGIRTNYTHVTLIERHWT